MVDGGQGIHPAVHILADDQIRRLRLGIFDADRLVAGLLDRLLQFRCEGHGYLHAPIVPALLARQEAGLDLTNSGVGSEIGGREQRWENRTGIGVQSSPVERIGSVIGPTVQILSPRLTKLKIACRRAIQPESALARKNAAVNGHERLEEAMAMLIQNEAAFLGRLSETERRLAESERLTSERFGRIEADIATILRVLAEHSRMLEEHSRMLERLPEAVRDKIGFKTQQ